MKTIKLSMVKKQENSSKSGNLIKLKIKSANNENIIEFGNIIRRKLLKDTDRLK